jgi:hypothetical protein
MLVLTPPCLAHPPAEIHADWGQASHGSPEPPEGGHQQSGILFDPTVVKTLDKLVTAWQFVNLIREP